MKTLTTTTIIACLMLISVANAQTVPSYVPTNGLSAWYSFSGNANDESGGGNDGTVSGATLTTGKQLIPNTAYLFDGASSTIDFVDPFLGGTQVSEFTFHALVYFNSTSNAPNIWGKTLFWGEVNFQISSSNEIIFWWANSITGNKYSGIYSDSNAVQPGQWYDIVVTYKNSSGTIYLNGSPITTNLYWNAQGGALISTTQIEASCNFAQNPGSSKLGVRYGNIQGYHGYLDGKIDAFGIWNRTLTQQEITNLYNGSSTCTTPTAVRLGTDRSTILCPNDSVNLFIVGPKDPSYTYQWVKNNIDIPGATADNFYAKELARYKVKVISGPAPNCRKTSGIIEPTAAVPAALTITPQGSTNICQGDSVLLSANVLPGYTYEWRKFGVIIPGATSPDYYAKQAGLYKVKATSPGGCVSNSNTISVNITCRISDPNAVNTDIMVYPNPANNQFTIKFGYIGEEKPVLAELRDNNGRLLEKRNLNSTEELLFNTSKLATGNYTVRVIFESGDSLEKVLNVVK